MVKQQTHQNQTKSQVRGKILQPFQSFTPSRKARLQPGIAEEMEDPRQFLRVNAGVGHHKEEASRRSDVSAGIQRQRRGRGVQGRGNLGQRGLCQGVK